MRGDRPVLGEPVRAAPEFTPHARGSTLNLGFMTTVFAVYPACAGIDPITPAITVTYTSLPRMRGDRPSLRD